MYKSIILFAFGVMIAFNAEAYPKASPVKTFHQTKQDTMSLHQYGKKIATLLFKKDWKGIVAEIYPVHLPDGWQAMVKPFFEQGFGRKLKVEVIPFESLPDHQLHWLNKAPEEVLRNAQEALRLSYHHSSNGNTDKGKLEMAVYHHNDTFSILLVGNG